MFAFGREVVAPGIARVLEAAAGGVFPFGFCGQAFSGPVAIGDGIVPRDVDDRVVPAVLHLCSRAFRAVPTRAFNGPPPGRVYDGLGDARCVFGGYKEVKDERPAKQFGFGFVRGCADEFGKFGVGDSAGVEVKGIDCDFAHGAFAVFGKALGAICAHQKGAARQANHAFERGVAPASHFLFARFLSFGSGGSARAATRGGHGDTPENGVIGCHAGLWHDTIGGVGCQEDRPGACPYGEWGCRCAIGAHSAESRCHPTARQNATIQQKVAGFHPLL